MQEKSFFRIYTIIPLVLLLSLLLSFSVTHAQDWYDANWLYRRAITINPANDLTNFPVLIAISDAALASHARSDGYDILFTDATGTAQLDHEIEYYAAGDLVAWVRVPSLSSSTNTILYLYYGNSGAANQEIPTGVWDANYVMVQHLEETSGNHNDSTVNSNDGTTVVVANQAATGNIDGADEFNGSTNYVRVPDNLDGSLQFGEGSLTAEAWINPISIPDSDGARIVNNRGTGVGGSYAGWQFKIQNEGGVWRFGDAGIDDAALPYEPYIGGNTYSYNQWYHVVMVYVADTEVRFYVNGQLDGVLAQSPSGSISNSLPTVIGASKVHQGIEDADNKQFFNGTIDEVRLSDTVRSAEWIQVSFTNQNNPGAFYGVGLEEPQCTLDTDCGFCEKCASGMCVFQVNEDLKGDCGVCETCDGTGACGFDTPGTPCTDDGNICTDDECDGAGVCVHPDNSAPCDDSDACTTSDTCAAGSCVGGGAPNCDDSNLCTDDSCDSVTGCVNTPNSAPCDDGLFCNGTDTCSGGSCTHTGDPCPGTECNTCQEATDSCFDQEGTLCTDDLNVCTDDTCNGLGSCVHFNNNAPCDDGIYCNGIDLCGEGSCSFHTGNPCPGTECNTCQESTASCFDPAGTVCADEGNVCTDDQCDGGGTCVHPNNSGPCDDGQWCTENDTCSGGVCGGTVRDCSGVDQCNDGICDEVSDQCVAQPKPDGTVCDDGLYCTLLNECHNGQCVRIGDPCLDDGSYCNGVEFCQEDIGNYLCISTGNPCFPPITCDESDNLCTDTDVTLIIADAYGYSGVIDIELVNEDQVIREVYVDVCDVDQRSWLQIDTTSCSTTMRSDEFTCTTTDLGGGCVRVDLTSSIFGVIGSGTGAIAQLSYTLDADASPIDFADLGPENISVKNLLNLTLSVTPIPGKVGVVECVDAVDCDDNNACTDDSCIGTVCFYNNIPGDCDVDGLFCTDDQCSSGVCSAGSARDCSGAGDQCNVGVCNDTTDACEAQPMTDGTACDDGLWCTEADECTGGLCDGTARDCSGLGDECNDGVCNDTTDSCEAQPQADGTSCDLDGLFCTDDRCSSGTCVAGPPPDCSGVGDQCNGVCDVQLDQCVAQPKPDGSPCDVDGLFCTDDQCASGVCSAGSARDCSGAGDQCNVGVCNDTTDVCEGQPLADGTACDDGLWCTETDECTGGLCGGTARDCSGLGDQCNDGVCNDTTDSCEAQPKAHGTFCDVDGLFCTDDRCSSGTCTTGFVRDCSGVGDQCNAGICDDGIDQCVSQPNPDGTACDDGLFCNGTDTCSGGICSDHSGDPCAQPLSICDEGLDICAALDNDSDGVFDDGNNSGIPGDDPCLDGVILNCDDNCPTTPNGPDLGTCLSGDVTGLVCTSDSDCGNEGFCGMNQEDTYPPQGNAIGDACDCEGDFDCDGSVAANDVTSFLMNFGRSLWSRPCTDLDPCDGDFNCDGSVDALDVAKFLEDFGRSQFFNPCPACNAGAWCSY